MSQDSSIKLNISQNHPDFELRPLDKQASLFKKGYLKKTLKSYIREYRGSPYIYY